jgi:hypothetical protein
MNFHIQPIIKASPGRSFSMKSKYLSRLHDPEGKGMVGCLAMIVLTGVAIYLAIELVPIYYSNFNLESDVKTEISRAGAHFLDDDTITKDILAMAKNNEIRLTKENVSIDRFAGQVHINVRYVVPVNLIIFDHDLVFKISVSSFVGTL